MLLTQRVIGTIAYLGGLPAVLEPFCWAWGQLIQYNNEYLVDRSKGEIVHYTRAKASFHAFARDSLVEQALGDWLLMLDTDHAPEPDLAARLLYRMDQYGCDVITGVYVHKMPPYTPVLYQYDEKGGMQPIARFPKAEAFQVASAGGGALLVRRAVFERIRAELKESPFAITPPFGEDHSFFLRLRTLGIDAYAVPTIESPHLEIQARTLADHHPPAADRVRTTLVKGFAHA